MGIGVPKNATSTSSDVSINVDAGTAASVDRQKITIYPDLAARSWPYPQSSRWCDNVRWYHRVCWCCDGDPKINDDNAKLEAGVRVPPDPTQIVLIVHHVIIRQNIPNRKRCTLSDCDYIEKRLCESRKDQLTFPELYESFTYFCQRLRSRIQAQ